MAGLLAGTGFRHKAVFGEGGLMVQWTKRVVEGVLAVLTVKETGDVHISKNVDHRAATVQKPVDWQ